MNALFSAVITKCTEKIYNGGIACDFGCEAIFSQKVICLFLFRAHIGPLFSTQNLQFW